MKRLVPLNKIKTNEINPRSINQDKFLQLVQSIKDFPSMLEARPIVVDETGTILGGNMRLQACRQAGLKEVWCYIVLEWSEEQKKQFIIKDNINFGQWDYDLLANEWEEEELIEWGLDLPIPKELKEFEEKEKNLCNTCGLELK